jgi:hypothetical protein
VAAVVAATYSASHEESATTRCLMDGQQINQLPRKKRVPLVLFLVSMSPARSLSL